MNFAPVLTESDKADAVKRLACSFFADPSGVESLQEAVKTERVSIYHATGEGCDLLIAGEAVGDCYFLWATAGKNVKAGIGELITHVERAGFRSIQAETKHKGLGRLARVLGVTEVNKDGWNQLNLRFNSNG